MVPPVHRERRRHYPLPEGVIIKNDNLIAAGIIIGCIVVIAIVVILASGAPVIHDPFKTFMPHNDFYPASPGNICPIRDYGNGTTVFLCTEMLYATSLSDYQGEHHLYASSAVALPDPSTANNDLGYLVTFIPQRGEN